MRRVDDPRASPPCVEQLDVLGEGHSLIKAAASRLCGLLEPGGCERGSASRSTEEVGGGHWEQLWLLSSGGFSL